jgi:hypothetical protein
MRWIAGCASGAAQERGALRALLSRCEVSELWLQELWVARRERERARERAVWPESNPGNSTNHKASAVTRWLLNQCGLLADWSRIGRKCIVV